MVTVRTIAAASIGCLAAALVAAGGHASDASSSAKPTEAAPAAAAPADSLQSLVAFVTDKKVHPIKEVDAKRTLSQFGQVERLQKISATSAYTVQVRPDLYASIDYSQDAAGNWADPEFAFYLFETKGLDETFSTLDRSISDKLGKPWKTKKVKGKTVNAVWNFKKPLKVWLSRAVETGPGHPTPVDHIELSVSKPEEEVRD